MPKGLKRYYGQHHLHFITCSCYRRLPLFRSVRAKDTFVSILADVRDRYGFALVGYVVMPEHVHLLIGEPPTGTPSTVLQILKERVSSKLRSNQEPYNQEDSDADHLNQLPCFWQLRFYDFNVWTLKKRVEKLGYMHLNPVKRGLVACRSEFVSMWFGDTRPKWLASALRKLPLRFWAWRHQ